VLRRAGDAVVASQSVPLPSRFRFASRDSATGTDDLAALLQSRLLVIAMVIGIIFVVFFLLLTTRIGAADAVTAASMARGRIIITLAIPPSLGCAWWLRQRTPRSMTALRRVEIALIAVFCFCIVLSMAADFPSLVSALDIAPVDLGLSQSVWMGLMIVAYGMMVPNRWQRTVKVIALILLATALVDLWCLRQYPISASSTVAYLSAQWSALFGFTAFAVFGAYRLEVASNTARDALKLGQYVLVEKLGAGGMGEVHRAEHRLLRRPCAVKLIRPEHAGDPEALRRFEREVQATAALTHPNTVAIYDYGISDDGTFYYVMEYLPGATLEEVVTRDGPMEPARAVHVLRQIAGALQEAHEAGLTHRDIKPGNVMLTARGGRRDVAKLLDFGLVTAHATGATGAAGQSDVTLAGMVVGTPAYMSPEQCAGDIQPGPPSDLYSLGALGFFLLTGRSPFEGRAALQMMIAHLHEPPPSAAALQPAVLPPLDHVLQRCLAKQAADRFASAADLEEALVSAMA